MGHWPGDVTAYDLVTILFRTRGGARSGGRFIITNNTPQQEHGPPCSALRRAGKGPTVQSKSANSARTFPPRWAQRHSCAPVRTGADDAVVEGLGHFVPLAAPVDCCESGSTLRFLIPIASLTGQAVSFTGRGRLMERPQSVYEACTGSRACGLSRALPG